MTGGGTCAVTANARSACRCRFLTAFSGRPREFFLTINGIQTMSAQSYNLLHELPDMIALGIDVVRLSPQAAHMADIIASFAAVRDGAAASTDTAQWSTSGLVDGYWFGDAGIRNHHAQDPVAPGA